MGGLDWLSILYAFGVLLLISPALAYILKAPYALRNATIWLAIIAALGWAYKLSNGQFDQFINMPNYVKQAPATPAAPATDALPESSPSPQPAQPDAGSEDNPVRNL